MFRNIFAATFLVALLSSACVIAQAQDDKKFELGAQGSLLRLPTITFRGTPGNVTSSEGHSNDWGFGGRVGYNISQYLAVEAEANVFLDDRAENGGQKFQGLFGGKVGKRFEKGGLFLKARPGFVRLSKGEFNCRVAVSPLSLPPIECFQPNATTNFAFDLGGVAEVYPTKNTIIRFDVGDMMIRFGRQRLVAATNLSTGAGVFVPRAPETKHNLQASLGVGFRF